MQMNIIHAEEEYFHKTTTLLQMFSERYLAIESAGAHKMALEITTSWECDDKSPVMLV